MRTVIVTGGSRGLGLGIATTLVAGGFRVVAVARQRTDALSAAIAESRGGLLFQPCDLADISGLAGLVSAVRKQAGPLYGLVNNAAIGTSGVLATMRTSDVERTVHLNTVAPLVLTRHAVRAMMAGGGATGGEGGRAGRIVNISSIVAATGFAGLSVYGATKAALVGFTRSLAREVGPLGITVNAVAPGFVDTAMTEGLDDGDRERIVRRSALKRLAEVTDVAQAVGFLVSDAARNITGTVLTVDAGGTA